jgi:hypothetical protein
MGILDKINELTEEENYILKYFIDIFRDGEKKEELLTLVSKLFVDLFIFNIKFFLTSHPKEDIVWHWFFPSLTILQEEHPTRQKRDIDYLLSIKKAWKLSKNRGVYVEEVDYLAPLFDYCLPYASTKYHKNSRKKNFIEAIFELEIKFNPHFSLEKIQPLLLDLFPKIEFLLKKEDIHIELLHGVKLLRSGDLTNKCFDSPTEDKNNFTEDKNNYISNFKTLSADGVILDYFFSDSQFEHTEKYPYGFILYFTKLEGKYFLSNLNTPVYLKYNDIFNEGLYNVVGMSFIALKSTIFIPQK